jgi:enoyl-CoA hydratase/carnithine racemase
MFTVDTTNGVTTLTLRHAPVNAISEEWIRIFDEKLDLLATEPRCAVLHIRSDQKVFCAGADLKEMRERMNVRDGADRMYAYVAGIQRLYARIERLPQVTVAEIAGAAMGGGLELALACDLRIAANEAKLGLPEVGLGLIPGAGGTQRLTRICGPSLAKRLILRAEIIDGVTAEKLSVVHWAVPRSELAQRTAAIVRGIASLPTEALAASKACIAAAGNSDRSGYTCELEFTRLLLNNVDTRKRVDAFLGDAAGPSTPMKRGASR